MQLFTRSIALATLITLALAPVATAQSNAEYERLRNQHAELQQQHATLKSENAALQTMVKEQQATITQQQAQAARLSAAINKLQAELATMRQDQVDNQEANLQVDGLRDYIMELKTENADLVEEKQRLAAEKKKLESTAAITAEDAMAQASGGLITETYDAQADQTVVSFTPQTLRATRGSSADFAVSLRMTYPGEKQRGKPASIVLDLETNTTTGRLVEPEQITIQLGDESVVLPVTEAQVSRRRGGSKKSNLTRSSLEATATMSLEQLAKIAKHSQGTLTFDVVEIDLTPRDLAVYRAMHSRTLGGE